MASPPGAAIWRLTMRDSGEAGTDTHFGKMDIGPRCHKPSVLNPAVLSTKSLVKAKAVSR